MKKLFTIVLIAFLGIFQTFAQSGFSSASMSMSRSLRGIMSSDQVIIEEFLNYHRHKIPLPKAGEELALDLSWGNDEINFEQNDKAVLQIGLTTNQVLDYSKIPPINTSIVIDRSGSMGEDDKLKKVKKALFKFIEGLRKNDIVSIVIYDTEAVVVLPATNISDIEKIKFVIDGISCGGITNLYNGLKLGCEEVLKNYNDNYSNRVILLTDGLANAGITDTETIISNSEKFINKGIDISTVGVGNNVNSYLLRQISRKGLNHFIGSNQEDIDKVFTDELESLLCPIGKNVSLEIEYPNQVKIDKIFGYSPEFRENKLVIPLNNINSGLTQVVIIQFKQNEVEENEENLPFKATLKYYSFSGKKEKKITVESELSVKKSDEENNNLINSEVKKNYFIGIMASSLKTMAEEVEKEKYDSAIEVLNNNLTNVKNQFPKLKDKDIIRVKEILENNLQILKSLLPSDKN